MNPLTVRIFNICNQKVESHFLDMCATTGNDAATAATLLDKIVKCLRNTRFHGTTVQDSELTTPTSMSEQELHHDKSQAEE